MLHLFSRFICLFNSFAFSVLCVFVSFFFFFKQKTAYEVRISDWSSDVCSSDLAAAADARADTKGETTSSDPVPGQAAELPAGLKPQLATLVDGPPRGGGDWLYEVKYDGYRIVARLDNGQARLYTHNGHDWSARLPHLVQAISKLDVPSAWIDGEKIGRAHV